jgi:hypothetical protein
MFQYKPQDSKSSIYLPVKFCCMLSPHICGLFVNGSFPMYFIQPFFGCFLSCVFVQGRGKGEHFLSAVLALPSALCILFQFLAAFFTVTVIHEKPHLWQHPYFYDDGDQWRAPGPIHKYYEVSGCDVAHDGVVSAQLTVNRVHGILCCRCLLRVQAELWSLRGAPVTTVHTADLD